MDAMLFREKLLFSLYRNGHRYATTSLTILGAEHDPGIRYGATVHLGHHQQLHALDCVAGNRCFGQSGRNSCARHTCTVVMNGKKVRMLVESWELLVATMVVLAFFLNLTGNNYCPIQNVGQRHGDRAHQADFTGKAVHAVYDSTSQFTSTKMGVHGGMSSRLPCLPLSIAHRRPEAANRGCIERLALQRARLQWLAKLSSTNSNSFTFTSGNTTSGACDLTESPSINRRS